MTREQAKELLPIIQAYADGKTVQGQTLNGTWVDLEDPIFIDEPYRIKPEPRVVWVNEFKHRDTVILGNNWWPSQESAKYEMGHDFVRTVKFIEVIES